MKGETLNCGQCRMPFKQRNAQGPRPKYCSNACRQAAFRAASVNCHLHPHRQALLTLRSGHRVCLECSYVCWLFMWMSRTSAMEPCPPWAGRNIRLVEN